MPSETDGSLLYGLGRKRCEYSHFTAKQAEACRQKASQLSKKALWSEFIKYYYQAYDIALKNSRKRNSL